MTPQRKWARFVFALAVCLAASGLVLRLAQPVAAQDAPGISRLAGPWQATLIWSGSGCGPMSGLVNFTLDKFGTSTAATLTTHSACGNLTSVETFTIYSLDADGSGTAGLSCGLGCGWELTIQVARNGQVFNIVDVSPANPG